MISFIIIGKNEGRKLKNCIQSVLDTLNYHSISKYEIIYVDSNSSDNSVDIASKFEITRIYKLTGDLNAAIGRNLGASKSQGNILFFIDGDMELNKTVFLE